MWLFVVSLLFWSVLAKDALLQPITNPNPGLQGKAEPTTQEWLKGVPETDVNPWRKQEWWWGSSSSDIGINLQWWCLTWMWEWCFKLDYLLWWKDSEIAKRNDNRTVLTIAQDVVLAATYMVWTVLTIVLIYCWLMYIFSSWKWKDPSKYKKWLIYAAIWACLVRGAYAIVRLIQYIAKW